MKESSGDFPLESANAARRTDRVPPLIPIPTSRQDPDSPSDTDTTCRRTLAGCFDAAGESGEDVPTEDTGRGQPQKAVEGPVNIRPSNPRFTSFFVRDILADSDILTDSDRATGRRGDSCQSSGAGSVPVEAREEPGQMGREREECRRDTSQTGMLS